MRYDRLPAFFVLSAAPLSPLAKSLQPHWGSMRMKHAWNEVPLNWEHLGHPAAESTIDLHIALKSRHENALTDALHEVSTPGHPKYRAYLSKERVTDLVAPDPHTLELINSWLRHYGVSPSMISMTHGGSWLTVSVLPVSQANDLLSASYQLYRHSATNLTVLRTMSYGIPAGLHAHVKSVSPTTYFGSTRRLGQKRRMRGGRGELVTTLSNRDSSVNPVFLIDLYEMEGYYPAAGERNRLGVAGFIKEYPNLDDLKMFMKEFRPEGANDATYEVIRIKDGGYNPDDPGLEANQNIQYTAALTYPTPLIFYSTSGTHNEDDHFINWIGHLLEQEDIPQTVTASYGVYEDDVPPDIAKSICDLFKELGARGVSALIPSGGDGVGEGNCKDESGNVHFRPFFPASCPWVTAVGGTTGRSEQAAVLSGGGFSNYSERPDFQDEVVPRFRRNLGSTYYSGFYNPLDRGIPDVSAQALEFIIVNKGKQTRFQGTSCSAPVRLSFAIRHTLPWRRVQRHHVWFESGLRY
ncbi:subtilisin-like protein [Lactarius indigo]|nr:subtilisin-like protein [Lactarius indigo]